MLRDGIMAARPPLSDERLATVERLAAFAEERGHSILELAMSWLASQPSIGAIIAGVTKADQVVANAAAADWRLSAEDLAGRRRDHRSRRRGPIACHLRVGLGILLDGCRLRGVSLIR